MYGEGEFLKIDKIKVKGDRTSWLFCTTWVYDIYEIASFLY